jgi:hypothetical protein
MKVKFTLEEEESKAICQALENIPVDLCGFVDCPDMDGDACENCPMAAIQHKWIEFHDRIREEFLPMIKRIEG